MPYSQPYHVGRGPHRPGVGSVATKYNGMWDFDTYDGVDSMQGWVPTITPNTRSSGTIADVNRPWQCLDWGNRFNAGPVQGRTPGIISAWHKDGGVNQPSNGYAGASPSWTPLAGSVSVWCGLRSGDDTTVIDALALGGTGNHINGEAVFGIIGDGVNNTQHNFPGYMNQWDQMLYRDVPIHDGAQLSVSFLYETDMDPRTNSAEASCKGWFDKDPLSMQQGGGGPGASNFISASAYQSTPARGGPVDSFMVYVGVPTDPDSCQYADGNARRPVFDLKRRWFSEVIAIDKPYKEILSTFGRDSAHRTSPLTVVLDNAAIQPMLDAQYGDSGGVIRVVFRSKTNANHSDETNTGGSFVSRNMGAVLLDNVEIMEGLPDGFSQGEGATGWLWRLLVKLAEFIIEEDQINNTSVSTPSNAFGVDGPGYALTAFHATGKSPKLMAHTHPLFGGYIGPGNYYSALTYADLCGAPDSPIRQCNINNVIISSTDHELGEAAGGAIGTPFKENRNGFLSPTINLVTPAMPGVNNCGLDRLHVETSDDWWIYYDIYTGIFNVTTQGNVWGNSIMSWPTVQKNGATVWGDLGYLTGVWYNPDKQCFLMNDVLKPNIFTSNESGIPDSCKLWIFREQRCISWSVTTGCSPTDGHYTDNVALALPPPLAGVSDKISIDIWDWYTDAFPVNETAGLPGTVAFDTCGAYIQTARNQAPNTGDLLRFDVPGDSIYVKAQNATGTELRMDCVFRVYPGPGNYVNIGNKASALRQVPASVTPAVSGDGSFWGQYLADPGTYSKGTHAGGWNVNTWNSVRCDTVELNWFPVNARQNNLPGIQDDFWMSTIHESDGKFATLGILKNRCFLTDTLGLLDHTNTDCTTVPAWLTINPQDYTGYNGQQQTKEYTKVFPDGLLTAGSHIEYFFRMAHLITPTEFVMTPDTNRISPQPTGSAWNYDGVRWEGISILPDKWKDAGYGGLGSACMLVVDYNDRRGDERVWVGAADSIGATVAAKYGAHNGWHATAAYIASDGSHNYASETDCGTNPAIAVWSHGGQPGTTWDLYNVKAAESSTTGGSQIGNRLASRAGMGLLAGKQSMQGPSPDMLRAYYNMLFIMSGDLNTSFFGAVTNRGQDDIAIVQDFLTYGADEDAPRGIWCMGHGFVEGNTGIDAAHTNFLSTNLAVSLRDPSYYALSGTTVGFPDLIPTSVINTAGAIYSAQNSCLFTNDVLDVNVAVSGATAGSYYQNLGGAGPYVSGVYAPSTSGHPYVSLIDGWDMFNTFSRHGGNTVGRMFYFIDVLTRTFGSVCAFTAAPTVDVPTNTGGNVNVDFLGNVWGNPMVAGGKAAVHFGLAKQDRVEVKVYDVTGRLVRSLADRTFQAGEHSLIWDGTNDQGRVVARGVYFTQVKFINSRFVDAKKVTVLK
jgi:hypothetical protein